MTSAHSSTPLLTALVLAAGKGTRMKSPLPKVLHAICGKPMVYHVLERLEQAGISRHVLVLSPEIVDTVEQHLTKNYSHISELGICTQTQAKGTGDAVASAAGFYPQLPQPAYAQGRVVRPLATSDHILICTGDAPAIEPAIIRQFIDFSLKSNADIALIGMQVSDPFGYGRLILDDSGHLLEIVEEKDATEQQRKINLCNSGMIYAKSSVLFGLLKDIQPTNRQQEYYLTDCFSLARQRGLTTMVYQTQDWQGFSGINDPWQLAQVESSMIKRHIADLARSGVRFFLPDTIYLDQDVIIEPGAEIGPGVSLYGKCHIKQGAHLGDRVTLRNVTVAAGCQVPAASRYENLHLNASDFIAK